MPKRKTFWRHIKKRGFFISGTFGTVAAEASLGRVGMFGFTVSPQFVRNTLRDLPWFGGLIVRYQLWRLGHRLEDIAPHWGIHVVAAIGTVVQRTRHAIYGAPECLVIIKDGKFVVEVADRIEQYTCFVGADRPVMRDLAQELLAYLRTKGLPEFHPGAPIMRLELEGDTLLAYLRPYTPPQPDPHWQRAIILE